jgi:hypothetical protein
MLLAQLRLLFERKQPPHVENEHSRMDTMDRLEALPNTS